MRQIKIIAKYEEFIKFCIVGCFCAGIDLLVFNIFKFFSVYRVCVVAGFIVSWCVNYILSSKWTFKEKPTVKNFGGMLIAHLINLFVVRMGLMFLFVDILNINSRLAYIPTLLISAITSFLMVRIAFKYK